VLCCAVLILLMSRSLVGLRAASIASELHTLCWGADHDTDAADPAVVPPPLQFRVEVSYLEIYNERIRDLLAPKTVSGKGVSSLKIREHPHTGR